MQSLDRSLLAFSFGLSRSRKFLELPPSHRLAWTSSEWKFPDDARVASLVEIPVPQTLFPASWRAMVLRFSFQKLGL